MTELMTDFNRLEDRCDRCGSQALYIAEKGGRRLMFCWHHGSKHEAALVASGWAIAKDEETYVSYGARLDVSPV